METLLGVETIHNQHRLREELPGQVPDPLRSVAQDDLPGRLPKAASLGLALDLLGELRKLGIGIQGSRGGRDRARIATRRGGEEVTVPISCSFSDPTGLESCVAKRCRIVVDQAIGNLLG